MTSKFIDLKLAFFRRSCNSFCWVLICNLDNTRTMIIEKYDMNIKQEHKEIYHGSLGRFDQAMSTRKLEIFLIDIKFYSGVDLKLLVEPIEISEMILAMTR